MKYDENFLQQLNIVVELLDERLNKEPDRPILKTLYSHYAKAINIVKNNGDIKQISIKGSMRAYLDSYSDYMNPLTQGMGKAERLFDSLLKGDKFE